MEETIVLNRLYQHKRQTSYHKAYSDPIAKINDKPIFCFSGIWSPLTMGIGKTKSTISEAIFATAVAIYRPGLLIHCPVAVTSQFIAILSQAKIRAKKIPML